jgi:SPP1 family predicted phage head-tail adaptor
MEIKKNRYDELEEKRVSKDVLAEIKSIGQSEKYQAQAYGLEPIIKFIMAEYLEYGGEPYVEYDGLLYKVDSTYLDKKTNYLELTCSRIINDNLLFEGGL